MSPRLRLLPFAPRLRPNEDPVEVRVLLSFLLPLMPPPMQKRMVQMRKAATEAQVQP